MSSTLDHATADNPTVLLVEDEVLIRMVSADALTDAGYHVLEAQNADEALALLERADRVEVLFTDVKMPGTMNGLELAEIVHARWPNIRLLVTSGHRMMTNSDIPDDGHFLPKPYRAESVLAEIGTILAAHRE